jgi:CBS domain containing-hemolysin-like protein
VLFSIGSTGAVNELLVKIYPTLKCSRTDRLSSLVHVMMRERTTLAVCLNDNNGCLATITIKDILRYYFDDLGSR